MGDARLRVPDALTWVAVVGAVATAAMLAASATSCVTAGAEGPPYCVNQSDAGDAAATLPVNDAEMCPDNYAYAST